MSDNPPILDRSDILAISALLISMVALIVSFYEAKIMKDQQEIMFSQQQAAVWPFVDANMAFQLGENLEMDFSLVNKGVGPAIIKNGQFMVDGKTLDKFKGDIYKAIAPKFPDTADLSIALSLVSNKVLSPGEEYRIISINCNRFEGDVTTIQQLGLNYKACFCSIYEDCWQVEEDQEGNKLPCN